MRRIAAAMCLGVMLLGCNPCKVVEAQFPVAQSYAQEADAALGQVEAVFSLISTTLPADTRNTISLNLRKAHQGLQTAVTVMRDAQAACKAPDLVSLFRDFNDAWNAIRPLIPVILAAAGQQGVGASGSVNTIQDPACFKAGRSK